MSHDTVGGSSTPISELRCADGIVMDVPGRRVLLHGTEVSLTKLEFDLLEALCSEPGHVLNRQQLLERVWGSGWGGDDHVVDVHVSNLRRKLGDDPRDPQIIRTVRGVGFAAAPPR